MKKVKKKVIKIRVMWKTKKMMKRKRKRVTKKAWRARRVNLVLRKL